MLLSVAIKNKEIIKAALEGKTIQRKIIFFFQESKKTEEKWEDLGSYLELYDAEEYRIKPEPKIQKIDIALYKYKEPCPSPFYINSFMNLIPTNIQKIEKDTNFIKWITHLELSY